MQQAGDNTKEDAGPTLSESRNGIGRWFPCGFRTEGVDWASLEEHLSAVPDLAFVKVTSDRRVAADEGDTLPQGVCALHFAVACCNPAAPLSLIQKLIEANPDALHQTEETSGWNVLHCAVKFNRNLSMDQGILQLLIRTKPDLVTEVTIAVEDFGLPPLAYANCKEVVPSLVKLMPPNQVVVILKKVFIQRRLIGGSLEAMEQIIQELSRLEIQRGRPILASGILPDKIARKQSLIEYALGQAAKRRKGSPERHDLMHLSNRIIQATFSLCFPKDGDEHDLALSSTPTPHDSLKTLVAQFKIKRRALELYESLQYDKKAYIENIDCVEPSHNRLLLPVPSSIHEPETLTEDTRKPAAKDTQREVLTDDNDSSDPFVRVRLEKLLRCKEDLDAKIDRSFGVLRQTAVSLEGYKEMYSKTVDALCQEAKTVPSARRPQAIREISTHTSRGSGVTEFMDENTASRRACASSLPPKPPTRTRSDPNLDSNRVILEQTIQDAIVNLKAATTALDRYNKNLHIESNALIKEQDDQKAFDLNFFRTNEYEQAAQAMKQAAECQTQRETIAKRIADIKQQLRMSKSPGAHNSHNVDRREMNAQLHHEKGELKIVEHKMDSYRKILTRRRQEVGSLMMKARRILNEKRCSKLSRRQATRFLCEAKKETRFLMSTLHNISLSSLSKGGAARRLKQRSRQKQVAEEDEELTRMTKRMKL